MRAGGAKAAKLFQSELRRAVVPETDARFLAVITTGIAATSHSTPRAPAFSFRRTADTSPFLTPCCPY